MKIAHIYYDFQLGGSENITLSIINNDQLNDHVILVLRKGAPYQRFCEEHHGIKFINLNWSGHGILRWSNWVSLYKALIDIKPAVVHTYMYDASLYGRVVAWLLGLPTVMSVMNTYDKKIRLRASVNRLLAFITKRIVVCSDDVRRDVRQYDGVSDKKITTISSFIKTDFQRDESYNLREKFNCKGDCYIGLTIARIVEQKGHRMLLDAIDCLVNQENIHYLRFIWIGDGVLTSCLAKSIKERGLEKYIYMVGQQTNLNPFLSQADFYIDSSIKAGLNLATIKAMEAELPVLMSRAGGAEQLTLDGKLAYLFNASDVQSLVVAVKRLLENSDLSQLMARQAREHILKYYSENSATQAYYQIYKEVVDVTA